MKQKPILKVSHLGVSFSQYTKGFRRQDLKVITDLEIELYPGKILAVVGSSGSGKSLLAHAILDILPKNATTEGEIIYKDSVLTKKDQEALRGKEIVLIPQSVNYLDPLQTVGKQVKISVKDKKNKDTVVTKLFQKYKLKKEVEDYYPFQLSGGMARKVLLTTALVSNAKIIIADEPTPGLDEDALNEVLRDFRELADAGCAILMITHDIQAALKIADDIAIFYAGTTLEIARTSDFDGDGKLLRHPYTKALNQALPSKSFVPLGGTQPQLGELSTGCLFCERCMEKSQACEEITPEFREIRSGKVRCIHAT